MLRRDPPTLVDRSDRPVIPLLVALYVSGELIFELYDGGLPSRRFSICWKRFVPGAADGGDEGSTDCHELFRPRRIVPK